MRLWEILPVFEHSQVICVYETDCDGFSYQGVAGGVPERLAMLNVDAMHAIEDEIEILVS